MTRVVVVGGGVAGLTFARELHRNVHGNVDVLVLESGGRRTGRAQRSFDDPVFTHATSTVVRTTERGPEWYPRGRGVGGGALINGRLAMEGTPSDWDAWSTTYGAHGWSWASVAPHVRAVPVETVASPDGDRWAAVGRSIGWRVEQTQVFAQPIDAMMAGVVRESSHVEALIVRDGRVEGVRTTTGEMIEADHVVLAAGALASPGLVLSSGLTENASVAGVTDHPALTFIVHAQTSHRGVGMVCRRDDMQIVTMHDRDQVMIIGALLRVYSRGTIERQGNDTSIDFGVLGDSRDVDGLGQCLDEMIRFAMCLGQEGQVFCGTESTPLAKLCDMHIGERIAWMRRNVSGNWHAACSMPMSANGLVDADGRVAGVPNLWCCDASVMCDLPRAPTQLPVMAIASTIAARFAARCVTS